MRKIGILLALIMAIMLLFACSATPEAIQSKAPEAVDSSPAVVDQQPQATAKVVGVSCMETSWQFFVPVNQATMDVAKVNGITVNMQDAKNDAQTQMNQIESFVSQGVNAIIVDTIDEGALKNPTADAIAKGIPVIARWTAIDGASCNMTLDEYAYGEAIGTLAATWANKNYPGEKVEVAIMGKFDYKPSVERVQGIKDALLKGFPTAQIVAENQSNDLQSAMSATEAVLQANPYVKILLGDDDDSAVGICQAVMAHIKKEDYPKYYVGGADAVDEAIRLIKEGTPYKATVDLHNYDIGAQTMQLIADYFNGKGLPAVYNFKFDPVSYEDAMSKY